MLCNPGSEGLEVAEPLVWEVKQVPNVQLEKDIIM